MQLKKIVRSDFKEVQECGGDLISYSLNLKIKKSDFEKISIGFMPNSMDDRWFIYEEEQTIYMHRSWYGTFICKIEIILHLDHVLFTNILFDSSNEKFISYLRNDPLKEVNSLLEMLEYLFELKSFPRAEKVLLEEE